MKIGIIGYGGMGSYHCDRLNNQYKKMTVVGGYDIKDEACQNMEKAGIKAYDSAEELLKHVDGVLIATPNSFHMGYAIMAAKAKKHIICEKPAAMNANEYKAMQKTAEDNNVMLVVHQNRRWDADFILIKQIINSGILGKVYKIESRVMAANGIPGDWRKITAFGGGMMLDWGVHLLDQAFMLIEPTSFNCTYSYVLKEQVDDGFDLKMRADGLEYDIVVDTNSYIPMPRWRIYGTAGTAQVDDWNLTGKMVLRTDGENLPQSIEAGNGLTKTMSLVGELSVREMPLPTLAKQATFPFYDMFLNAVKTGESSIKHSQVIKVLEFMEQVTKSAAVLKL